MFNPSTNTECRSGRPSPSVSSWMLMRSLPGKCRGGGGGTLSYTERHTLSRLMRVRPAGDGYWRYSTTHIRPRSSKFRNTGWAIRGSASNGSHSRSSATRNRARDSPGLNAAAGASCGRSGGGVTGAGSWAVASGRAAIVVVVVVVPSAGRASMAASFGAGTMGRPAIGASAGGSGSRKPHRMPLSSRRRNEAVAKSSGLPSEVAKTLRPWAVFTQATGSMVVCPSTRPCIRTVTESVGRDCL